MIQSREERDGNDKIIVYKSFDTTIQANLAITKLTAYGIPCFLTEENFHNLYPIPTNSVYGVRLHIFEADLARVKEILKEEIEESDKPLCPHCKSKKISFEESESFGYRLKKVLASFIFFPPPKNIWRCLDCEREFETPDNF